MEIPLLITIDLLKVVRPIHEKNTVKKFFYLPIISYLPTQKILPQYIAWKTYQMACAVLILESIQYELFLLNLVLEQKARYFGMDQWDYSKRCFFEGTINIAKSMALAYWRGSTTLIGGGDTMEGMKKAGVSENEVSHVSTGGGATLRFFTGDKMPGLFILN